MAKKVVQEICGSKMWQSSETFQMKPEDDCQTEKVTAADMSATCSVLLYPVESDSLVMKGTVQLLGLEKGMQC